MYKKIYLEITNVCNLNCSFCIHNTRKPEYMNFANFKIILDKLTNETKYLYFHLLGEPLMHPLINEFIKEANNNYEVNLTTNGYLINNLKENVRQLNISLHAFESNNQVSLNDYMNNIFKKVDELSNTYISYRFWVNSEHNKEILNLINNHYQTKIKFEEIKGSIKVKDKIYISLDEEFMWPDINHGLNIEMGFCQAIKDQLGILVDGTVVPCCLDTKGDISLGNILNNSLKEITEGSRYQTLKKSFHNNYREEVLCRNCSYKLKKDV